MSQPTGTTDDKAAEKNETSKIDIVAEAQPSDTANNNVALPLPATKSTYQRVEKGTRTALLYWDGWLSAQDARLAEDDPEYFSKSGGKPGEGGPKRNLNLKKNWTYGKNGEIQYIPTGFVGLFDKQSADGEQNRSSYGKGGAAGSSYGLLGNSGYGKSGGTYVKPTGPSVGNIWDLKGKPGNQSAYADVTSGRGGVGGSNKALKDDDKDYYGKAGGIGGQNRSSYGSAAGGKSGPGSAYMEVGAGGNYSGGASGNSSGKCYNEQSYLSGYTLVDPKDKDNKYAQKRKHIAKKNYTIGPNGEIIYIPTGFVGLFDKRPEGGAAASSGASDGAGGQNKSFYGKSAVGTPGGQNRSSYGSAGGKSGTGSAYMEVGGSSYGNAGNASNYGSGKGCNEQSYLSGYTLVDPKEKDNKYALKRKYIAKKNYTIGPNGEIIYIPTGFVGFFDKRPDSGAATSGADGANGSAAGQQQHGSATSPGQSRFGSYGKSGGANAGSSYSNSNVGSGGGAYSKPGGPSVGNIWDLKGKPGNHSAYADVTSPGGSSGSSKGLKDDDKDYYGKAGGSGTGQHRFASYAGSHGGKSGTGSAYMDPHSAGHGGSHGAASGSGGQNGAGGSHGGSHGVGHSGGKAGTGSAYMDVHGGGSHSAAGGSHGSAGSSGGAHGSTKEHSYLAGYALVDPKDKDNKYAQKRIAIMKKNYTIGPNGEITYIPTGFVGFFDKRSDGAASSGTAGQQHHGGAISPGQQQHNGAASPGQSRFASYGRSAGAAAGSSYANAGNGKGYSKPGGPSVGNIWDLKGKGNHSTYADVTSPGKK